MRIYVREPAFDGAHHVGQRDLARRAREQVAAVGTAPGAHDARVPKLGEDPLEERERDRLRLSQALARRRASARGTAGSLDVAVALTRRC